jgi:hypothetical protein
MLPSVTVAFPLFTVKVTAWLAVPAVLVAVKVMAKVPACAGLPLSTPVAELKATPVGKAPLSVIVGVGEPVAVTVKEPGTPTVNVVLLALVIAGGMGVAVPVPPKDTVSGADV